MTAKTRVTIWILAAVWLAGLAMLAPKFLSISRDTKRVERIFADYGAALVAHHFENAYQLCSPDFQAATSYEQFVNWQDNMETRYGRLKSVERQALKVHCDNAGCTATISASLKYENGTVQYKYALHKDGDRWSIFGGQEL